MKSHDEIDEFGGEQPVEEGGGIQTGPPLSVQRVRTLREVEQEHVQYALRVSNGNKKRAAAALGISRDTLYRKIAEFGLAANAPIDRVEAGRRRS
ncbi:MAG: helix-turn-helix domain-containing protein [Vicinamibacterales bacterium]